MSKVKSIKITNFKAIDKFEADFNGCTAIITAGNNKGKTSFLRGFPDRIRFIRPDVMVKSGATQGSGEMKLDTGESFIWSFNTDGQDILKYISPDGKRKTNVTKELGAKFFPPVFDIDKFLQSSPQQQTKQLQKIIGIDFTEWEQKYQTAYEDREFKNRESEKYHVKLSSMIACAPVEPVDLTILQGKKDAERKKLNNMHIAAKNANIEAKRLWNEANQAITQSENERVKNLYLTNKKINDDSRNAWLLSKKQIDEAVSLHNAKQSTINDEIISCEKALITLKTYGYDGNEVIRFIKHMKESQKDFQIADSMYPDEPFYIQENFEPTYNYLPEPEYQNEMPDSSELDNLDAQILKAQETNILAQQYKNYIDYKKNVESAKKRANDAAQNVANLISERNKMIASAKFPQGIDITESGIITVDGLPLDRNQISTSKLYMAALRIASMNLGEVKTLYFDASFLDRNNLSEIQEWANSNGLQLLIERPDFDGGEIKYEIIEDNSKNPNNETEIFF